MPTIIKPATCQQDDDGFSNEKLLKTHQTKPITSKQTSIFETASEPHHPTNQGESRDLQVEETRSRPNSPKSSKKIDHLFLVTKEPRATFADMPSFQPCANIRELEAMKHFKA